MELDNPERRMVDQISGAIINQRPAAEQSAEAAQPMSERPVSNIIPDPEWEKAFWKWFYEERKSHPNSALSLAKEAWQAARAGMGERQDAAELTPEYFAKTRPSFGQLQFIKMIISETLLLSSVERESKEPPAFPSGEAMCGSLELLGIIWHDDMVEEGEPWEVIAEPEPQFFETLDEAVDFYRSLKNNPERAESPVDRAVGERTDLLKPEDVANWLRENGPWSCSGNSAAQQFLKQFVLPSAPTGEKK